jgi:hypothetical protein
LTIALAGADRQLHLVAGPQTSIELNGKAASGGKPLVLADLMPGDRVTALHFEDQDRETALKISAVRVVPGEGVVRAIDLKRREVSIAAGAEETAAVTVWPLDDSGNALALLPACELSPVPVRHLPNQLIIGKLHLAGMTDRYALAIYKRIFLPRSDTIFE